MKYAIILPDGAADEPLPQLGGRTPLEVARIPAIDRLARQGRLGRVVTVPAGFSPGTDVATLALLGYDPRECYPGRAPIEAAARGLDAAPDQLIFRCNFVTIRDGRMKDFTADHIAQPEADRLIADLNLLARSPAEPALRGCVFHAGLSYRNLMIAAGAADLDPQCDPPHDIPDRPVARHLPRGRGAARLRVIMDRAARLLADHEVNRVRRRQRRPPVTDIWLWGQGRPGKLAPFAERFGLSAAVIAAVDIVRGLAAMSGMSLIDVPGATGYIDTNYAGKGQAATRALQEFDLVVVHVEAPDEAGHLGAPRLKVAALESVDRLIVGPLLEALRQHGRWRALLAPDHPTPCTTTTHSAEPPPFCLSGHGVAPAGGRPFSEAQAAAAGWLVNPGHRLAQILFRR